MKNNIKNMIWVVMANGISSLSQWILISIIIKYFGIESAGLYSSGTALILPIITFMGLNLRAIQLTDVENKYKLSDCFATRLLGLSFSIVLVIGITLWKGYSITAFLITLVLLVRYVSDLFSETAQSQLIKNNLFSDYGKSRIIRSVTSVGLFVILAYFTENFVFSLAIYSLIWFGVFILRDAKNVSLAKEFKGLQSKLEIYT